MFLETEFVKFGQIQENTIIYTHLQCFHLWKWLWMILLSVASNSSIVCILAHFSSEIVPVYCIIGCLTVASIFVSFAINDAKVQLFFDVCKELSIFLQKIFLFAVNPLCQRPRTLQTYTAKDNTNFRKSS